MECVTTTKCVLSKLGFLALVGFAAVVLTGPVLAILGFALWLVLAVLSVVLPFAFVGFLVWLPFHLLQKWQINRQHLARLRTAARERVISPPARCCAGAIRRTASATASAWGKCRVLGRAVSGVALETICGAATLGMLAGLVATSLPKRQMEAYILVGILLGSLFGFLIGLANYAPCRGALSEDGPCQS